MKLKLHGALALQGWGQGLGCFFVGSGIPHSHRGVPPSHHDSCRHQHPAWPHGSSVPQSGGVKWGAPPSAALRGRLTPRCPGAWG